MFPIAVFQVSHHYPACLSLEPVYKFLPKWAFANARNVEAILPEISAAACFSIFLMYVIIDA